jgi:hypothetical protein
VSSPPWIFRLFDRLGFPQWIPVALMIIQSPLMIMLPFVAVGGLFGRTRLGFGIGLLVVALVYAVAMVVMAIGGVPN